MSYRFGLQAVTIWAALPAIVAPASTLQQLSFEQLLKHAHVIVRGHVQHLKPVPRSDGAFVITQVNISVAEQFKGRDVSAVIVELPGGSMGDVVQAAPGTPQFAPGEHVIVFLEQRAPGSYRIIGGKQGKFIVNTEPGSERKVVENFAHRTESYDSFVERLAKPAKQPK